MDLEYAINQLQFSPPCSRYFSTCAPATSGSLGASGGKSFRVFNIRSWIRSAVLQSLYQQEIYESLFLQRGWHVSGRASPSAHVAPAGCTAAMLSAGCAPLCKRLRSLEAAYLREASHGRGAHQSHYKVSQTSTSPAVFKVFLAMYTMVRAALPTAMADLGSCHTQVH